MTYGGIDRFWWRDCHLVQHPRHPFSKLRTEQAGAELHKRPPDDPPDPPKQPAGEQVPRKRSRHRPDPHVPAAPEQAQQQKDSYAAGQPDHHLGMAKQGHLGLKDMIRGLTLGDQGLTSTQLVQAFVNWRRGPG